MRLHGSLWALQSVATLLTVYLGHGRFDVNVEDIIRHKRRQMSFKIASLFDLLISPYSHLILNHINVTILLQALQCQVLLVTCQFSYVIFVEILDVAHLKIPLDPDLFDVYLMNKLNVSLVSCIFLPRDWLIFEEICEVNILNLFFLPSWCVFYGNYVNSVSGQSNTCFITHLNNNGESPFSYTVRIISH